MYQQDVIVKDSDKQFRLRIDGYLRSIGIYQIIITNKYMEIEFLNGLGIQISYPSKIRILPDVIESNLLLDTGLSRRQIGKVKQFVSDYIEQIDSTLKELR